MPQKRAFHDLQFEFVGLLEEISRDTPRLYTAAMLAFSLVGYAYIALLFALLILFAVYVWHIAPVVGVMAGIAVTLLGLSFGSLFWVRSEDEGGIQIAQEDAPALFAELESQRRRLRAPALTAIIIRDDFRASITQRWGRSLLSGRRHCLWLGLELLMSHTPEQARATLAHEYAHISRLHGAIDQWVWRTRSGWSRLSTALRQSRHWSRFLLTGFFDRYDALFSTISFVARRQHEFEADALAAELAGARAFAESTFLIRLQFDAMQRELWKPLLRSATEQVEPPRRVNTDLCGPFLRAARHFSAESIRAVLRRDANPEDAHPPQRERFRAVGQLDYFDGLATQGGWDRPAVLVTAAEHFLTPEALERIVAECDAYFFEVNRARWKELREAALAARTRLAELEAIASSRPLTVDEAWERAMKTNEIADQSETARLVREVLALSPTHALASRWIGALLLSEEDAGGIALIERAIALDPDLAVDGYGQIVAYFVRAGRAADAVPYRTRLNGAHRIEREAREERRGFRLEDEGVASTLTATAVASLQRTLAADPGVRRAYLLDKRVRFHPERPYRVLCIESRAKWLVWHTVAYDREVAHRLRKAIPTENGADFVLVFHNTSPRYRLKLSRVPGALIYDRAAPQEAPVA